MYISQYLIIFNYIIYYLFIFLFIFYYIIYSGKCAEKLFIVLIKYLDTEHIAPSFQL